MQEDPNKVVYFAETDSRNRRTKFGIKTKDRSRHMYVIGKTGMGKSTLLENLAIQDIQENRGCIFIDPHGKTADLLLDYVPESRINDVLYFAPFDLDYPISFNVMEDVGADKRHLVANGLMSAFKKIWVDAWSARMEYILNNILLALLEYPDSTLIGVNRMLADEDYRKKVVAYVTDPSVKAFWVDEFAKYGPKYMQEAGAAIQNKIGQFISNPLIRNIIGQPKSTFDIRQMIDDRKIIIINLSKGRVGESNANLLGSMMITKIYLAAMSRADLPEVELNKLPNAYLYVDEFQNFANESFADILSEARKYKLNLTVAHQYIEQMTDEVRAAVFGNVGTMVAFRVGAFDAEVLEKEFAPEFTMEDIVNLGFAQVYLKLMIDGVSSKPFSATTLAPIAKSEMNFKDRIMDASRRSYGRGRADVENEIKRWHEESRSGAPEKRPDDRASKPRQSPIDQALSAVLGHAPMPRPSPQPVAPNATRPQSAPRTNGENRERDLRKAVSLSYLRQTQEKKEKKAPSEEHLADLRAALASITADVLDGTKTEAPKVEPEIKKDILPKDSPKEVPEDILKRILEIE
ncbi:MAG: type IV secretion system DNA-binding domain-containing protein [Patescibacteria group bacterium]